MRLRTWYQVAGISEAGIESFAMKKTNDSPGFE